MVLTVEADVKKVLNLKLEEEGVNPLSESPPGGGDFSVSPPGTGELQN